MDDNVHIEDLRTFFMGQVVMYKNRPTKVTMITGEFKYKLLDLETQKQTIVLRAHKDITPPHRRLGMLTIGSLSYYLTRLPARRMQMGLNQNNVRMTRLPFKPDELRDMIDKVCEFDSRELALCMLNKYPSIAEAFEEAHDMFGCVAFDKQFAIDHKGRIYYKTHLVGITSKKSGFQITFDPGFAHLAILLDGNHEKSIRDFGTTFA